MHLKCSGVPGVPLGKEWYDNTDLRVRWGGWDLGNGAQSRELTYRENSVSP